MAYSTGRFFLSPPEIVSLFLINRDHIHIMMIKQFYQELSKSKKLQENFFTHGF